ncbi:MAG: S-layer family protein, partial [Coleofasciculaceae cyanobacterium]
LVFLTNQYQPNPDLSGDITVSTNLSAGGSPGGDVFIDSRGKIITPANPDAGLFVSTLDTSGSNGEPGGDITLLAIGDIIMPRFSKITSYGSGGGNIILKSASAIIQEEGSVADFDSYIESGVVGGSEPGGDVILEAPSIFLSNFVQNSTYGGDGPGGDLIITADSFTVDSEGALVSTYAVSGDAGNTTIVANSISLNDAVLGSLSESSAGGDAGDVLITTNSFVGTNGGQVISSTGGSADGDDRANAGNVTVTADMITLIGTKSGSDIFSGFSSDVRPNAEGEGGNVTVNTRTLSIQDGGEIRTSTSGMGNAGEIDVTAEESIVMDGSKLSPLDNETVLPSGILSEVRPNAQGDGGVITVKTGQLSVTNGAFLSATTRGTGDAGDIFIEATESASFDGNPGEPLFPSGAFVRVRDEAIGDGGTLKITTPSLSLTNGAQLLAQLNTGAQGNTGTIMINASDSVLLSGVDTGLFSNTEPGTTGDGGNIMIANPELVEIKDGAAISVDSQGSGRGGSVQIMADKLILDNQGAISAETASTDGGNISLNLSDFLLLRRNSRISTTAGTAGDGGDGGNIRVNTDFIVAVDEENSDITANAFLGDGGNINIQATGIFGIEFREQLTSLSDITASSELGISGNVSINDPEVDPESGLVELPADLSDSSNQVVTACAAAEGNSFSITGRGGLPTDPTATIRGQTLLSDLRDFATTEGENLAENPLANSPSPKPDRQAVIVEATSWRINGQGKIELVAALPKESLPQRPISCSKS